MILRFFWKSWAKHTFLTWKSKNYLHIEKKIKKTYQQCEQILVEWLMSYINFFFVFVFELEQGCKINFFFCSVLEPVAFFQKRL